MRYGIWIVRDAGHQYLWHARWAISEKKKNICRRLTKKSHRFSPLKCQWGRQAMIRNSFFISFIAVWVINTYGLYRMVHGWEGATWRETYNWISSILVFDTIPLLAMLAGAMCFVGDKSERLKWRIVGAAMLAASLIIGMIFGFSIFTDPIVKLLER